MDGCLNGCGGGVGGGGGVGSGGGDCCRRKGQFLNPEDLTNWTTSDMESP